MRLLDKITGVRSELPDPQQVALMSATWPMQEFERIQQTYLSYVVDGYSSNSVVFATILQRIQLLAQAQFKYQNKTTRKLFGDQSLGLLEEPWPNGTTADLIARMEQHGSIAGNAFVRKVDDNLLDVLRPDWVDILGVEVVTGVDAYGTPMVHQEVIGYLYSYGGIGVGVPVFYDVSEVAHWTPIPDPLSRWRGMSWMTPVLREINADTAMTQHRKVFFDNATTPGIILKYADKLDQTTVDSIRDRWLARYQGPNKAGATVVLDEGADPMVLGPTFEQMRFTDIQAAGEARIASASGVPAIVAGLQSGLDSNAYNVYKMAMQAMANGTGAYLWRSMCASLAKLVTVPGGARLWYDTSDIPALADEEKDRATIMQTRAAAASTLLTSGYTADSIALAITSGDFTLLEHTGLVSVQLYKAAAHESASIPANNIPTEPGVVKPPTLPAA